MTTTPTSYEKAIQGRTTWHFLKGYMIRYLSFLKHERARRIARKRGATIGENTVLPLSLAKKANSNLIVGHNTSINTDKIVLAAPVKIGNYVIIGSGVNILTGSHNINSPDFKTQLFGIEIEDYVWITTNVLVTPSCRRIEYGAVVSAGSVVLTNVEKMSIVVGNPAEYLVCRKQVHKDLVVESLLGGDFKEYIRAWKNRK
jgi:maltose O-acetyltransferase